MNKGLERLNNKNLPCSNCKELKALEILVKVFKEEINTDYLVLDYLTKEENDLLKEVLL